MLVEVGDIGLVQLVMACGNVTGKGFVASGGFTKHEIDKSSEAAAHQPDEGQVNVGSIDLAEEMKPPALLVQVDGDPRTSRRSRQRTEPVDGVGNVPTSRSWGCCIKVEQARDLAFL